MDRLTATNRLNDGGRLLVENPQAAEFYAPLTNSIIPQRGVGAVSYTRATIATVTDHEGVIRNCIAGEARFQGARRVRNLTSYSQDLSISWNKFSVTVSGTKVAYTDGSLIGQTVVSAAASAVHYVSNGTGPVIIGNTYLFSVSVKAAGVNFVQLAFAASTTYQNFDLTNGSMTGTAGAGSVVDEGNGWYRCTVKFVSTLGTNAGQGIVIVSSMSDVRLSPNLGDGVSGISVCRMQLEDVTGQSIQTPSEYVSTNVLTAAPYHGANVDGVKYFKTDKSGNPISPDTLKGFLCEGARTNLFLQSEDFSSVSWYKNNGSVVANFALSPSGYTNAYKFVPTAGTSQSYLTQSVTVVASIYTISFYLKSAGKQFVQMVAGGLISGGYVNFDIVNGVVGSSNLWSGYIEAVAGFPGMYRCSITTETVTAGTGFFSLYVVDSNSATRGATSVNNGSDSIIVWGAQFELGPNVSSYIPTTTTTVTRNIDVLTYDVKNAIANQGAFSAVFYVTDDEQFDRRAIGLSSNTVNRLQFQVRRAGIPYTNLLYGDGATVRSVTSTQEVGANNIAVSWTNGVSVNMYMNNTKYSSVDIPNLIFSMVDVGGGVLGYPIFGCTKNLRVWKTLPTDAELLSLSNQS